jgi:hypothetical protein
MNRYRRAGVEIAVVEECLANGSVDRAIVKALEAGEGARA